VVKLILIRIGRKLTRCLWWMHW